MQLKSIYKKYFYFLGLHRIYWKYVGLANWNQTKDKYYNNMAGNSITLVMTYPYSVKLWFESGTFERDMRVYNELWEFGINVNIIFLYLSCNEIDMIINKNNNNSLINLLSRRALSE